jgi:hypothetical protein
MIMKITMSLAALALCGGLTVGTAFAQHAGARSTNDNAIPTGQSVQSTQPAQAGAPYDQPSGYDRPGGTVGCTMRRLAWARAIKARMKVARRGSAPTIRQAEPISASTDAASRAPDEGTEPLSPDRSEPAGLGSPCRSPEGFASSASR